MKKIYPPKLKPGDTIRVIAPSKSLNALTKEAQKEAEKRFLQIGLQISFAKHVHEMDELESSSIKSRVDDIHTAFKDKNVKAILCAAGGFNSNELLNYINWDVIKSNPKIFCGYSDITTLEAAILSETNLVTYAGPMFGDFSNSKYLDYTLEYFTKCLMREEEYTVKSNKIWSNKWSKFHPFHFNDGFWPIQEGKNEGEIIGENLITLNLLKGSEYFPNLKNSILFLEDDYENEPQHIDRNIQALILDGYFEYIKGLVIGRFQEQTQMNKKLLKKIIETKKELRGIPILANVDFGHTVPKITYPFGGRARLIVKKYSSELTILDH